MEAVCLMPFLPRFLNSIVPMNYIKPGESHSTMRVRHTGLGIRVHSWVMYTSYAKERTTVRDKPNRVLATCFRQFSGTPVT